MQKNAREKKIERKKVEQLMVKKKQACLNSIEIKLDEVVKIVLNFNK